MTNETELLQEVREIKSFAEKHHRRQRNTAIILVVFMAGMIGYSWYEFSGFDGYTGYGDRYGESALQDHEGLRFTNLRFSLVESACGEGCRKKVVLVGTFKNEATMPVKDLEFNATFRNDSGELTDVVEESFWGEQIKVGGHRNFRVWGEAVTSDESGYANVAIEIIDGEFGH